MRPPRVERPLAFATDRSLTSRSAARRTSRGPRIGALLVSWLVAFGPRPALADDAEVAVDAAFQLPPELEGAAFATPAALCRAYVAAATRQLEAQPPSEWDPLLFARTPRCTAEPRPLPFAGDRTWRSLRVLHADDGVGTSSRLAIETPRGFVLAPFAWGIVDPRDPGCPSIVRHVAIDEVSVERGRLVIVMAGENATSGDSDADDETGAWRRLVRVPYWSTDARGSGAFATTDPWREGATLGSKVLRARSSIGARTWAAVPWTARRKLSFDEAGGARSAPTRAPLRDAVRHGAGAP